MFQFKNKDVECNFDNNYLYIKRISNDKLSLDTKCRRCKFYTGVRCHGHGDYWGNCIIYSLVDSSADYYDTIVYDDTPCIVIKYLEFLKGDKNGIEI